MRIGVMQALSQCHQLPCHLSSILCFSLFPFPCAQGGPDHLHTYIVPGSLLWICLILSGPSRNCITTLWLSEGLSEWWSQVPPPREWNVPTEQMQVPCHPWNGKWGQFPLDLVLMMGEGGSTSLTSTLTLLGGCQHSLCYRSQTAS